MGRFYWTEDLVIRGIRALWAENQPLNSMALQRNIPGSSAVLSHALGFETTGRKLLIGGCHAFGSWPKALRCAGVNPKTVQLHQNFWTKALVIKGIRALYKQGIPLNTTAMRRALGQPSQKILRLALGRTINGRNLHAAALRHFESWNEALEVAGLSLQEVRKDQAFWTKDLIIKAMLALHEEGIPLQCAILIRDRSSVTSEIIHKSIGHAVPGSALYSAAHKKFGSLTIALKRAGIGPHEVRGDLKYWRKEHIQDSILALHKKGIPLNVAKIEKDRTLETTKIINEASGLNTTGFRLYRAAAKKFGSWDKAILASGLDPALIRRTDSSWTKILIVKAIQVLHKEGIPLNRTSLENDQHGSATQILRELTGKNVDARRLLCISKKRFGSWDNALKAAGLDPLEIRKDKAFWTRQMIIDAILALDKAGVPLGYTALQSDETMKTKRILYEVTGRKVSGSALYSVVISRFGSFSKTLKVARMHPKKVGRMSESWNEKVILHSIRELDRNGIRLNVANVEQNDRKRIHEVLKKTISGPLTGGTLYRHCTRRFSSWDEALRCAGFDPCKVRIMASPISKSGHKISEVIRLVDQAKLPLNSTAVGTNAKTIRSLTCHTLGKVISGWSLIKAGRKVTGGWEQALRDAGLDPIEIVLQGSCTWNLPVISHQVERIERGDGTVRKVAFMGSAPKTPEELHEEHVLSQGLDQAVSELDEEDRAIASQVFDMILSIGVISDQMSLIDKIVEKSEDRISRQQVKRIFQCLSENPTLLSLR